MLKLYSNHFRINVGVLQLLDMPWRLMSDEGYGYSLRISSWS
jgi:hypothetical protein